MNRENIKLGMASLLVTTMGVWSGWTIIKIIHDFYGDRYYFLSTETVPMILMFIAYTYGSLVSPMAVVVYFGKRIKERSTKLFWVIMAILITNLIVTILSQIYGWAYMNFSQYVPSSLG
jgi:hypothetical protein